MHVHSSPHFLKEWTQANCGSTQSQVLTLLGAHLSDAKVLPRVASHILFSEASAWSPWWTRTCTAHSSVCRSSWSTAAGRSGAQSGGSLCSGRVWSEGSRHPLHSDRSCGGRKASHYKEGHTTGKTTLQWKVSPPKENVQKQTSQNDYKHENIQTQMKTITTN